MFLFIFVFINEELWFKLIMIVFSILFYGYSFMFYKRCFSNLKGFKIEINKSKVTLPFTKNNIRLFFNLLEVRDIDVYQSFDTEVVEFKSNKGYLIIEKSWMRKKEYNEFLKILKDNTSLN